MGVNSAVASCANCGVHHAVLASFASVRSLKQWSLWAIEFAFHGFQTDFASRDGLKPSAVRTAIEAAVLNPPQMAAGADDNENLLHYAITSGVSM
jgi:hypothetical protein